ncbi:tRNA (adenosine(37)-N6)-threonylcarbamoyltransferase complex ATPase subunit type 1 TsaE [Moraxella nasovis]|uniref:tRNA (adenosine(37)-N6)-threonylcarbamoyltransferase complex ATPase subunit type 1 TsaE n=1 Tax=Moraxella nasovis TaxID=2904121 RepID=UPI001F614F34|nr:tRNA (adenosine(37)-N6)-threonylcarbamoyltransferase complex ATPase subunit type 1 TsaE [Moraxella nasovis]UNU73135.1 tRNA (adenosine(37)-N6)-threonylcarbamoyltransferase complex ATPase subunit type 1 TsaE [Moraxella nasovis]
MTTQTFILSDEKQTEQFAKCLAELNPTGFIRLSGDLGAGKTTLTRHLLRALGHKGSVKSPTFTLVEPYQITQPNGELKSVYHADLYRLNDPEELDFIGFFEYFDEPNVLVIIEWASRAETLLPKPDLTIKIKQLKNDCRSVTVTSPNDTINLAHLNLTDLNV